MGKKTRTGTSRRPILQLSPPGPRGISREEALGSASEDEQEGSVDGRAHSTLKDPTLDMRTPAVKATEGLSLLGAYEDSEEEEDAADSHLAPAKAKHNQSADIDSTLANFMAEIDAITMQPGPQTDEQPSANPPAPTPPQPDPRDHQQASEQVGSGAEFQYDTQYSLAGAGVEMGDWQEVWDENTGCYYYWNTQTNEVTWQLPHYLADQVQGLQQYTDSSAVVVNGNGTVHNASIYSGQHSAVATSALGTSKEGKKKEVMESVVALTSEEEERRGVAASLLAPLIPPEVKEAEEKWRKKTLGLAEDASEELLNSEAECARPPASPPAADAQVRSQSGHRSRTESPASSEDEEVEEAEEDTMELELVLERKKAELRALEEGDGSAGGSSPCSETSQEGTRGLLLRKTKWKTAFLRAPSPDSSSRGSAKTGRDTPEQPDSVDSKTSEKPAKEDPREVDISVEKVKMRTASTEEEELADLKFQIGELANTLTSKMEFLGINKKAITNFQLLLIQTETRIADWREGALNGNYLRRRLQEAAEHIKHYELNATPKGWSCHWDREHRRYFYVNERTAASQWDFPAEEESVEEKGSDLKGRTSPLPGAGSQGEAKPPAEPPTTQAAPPVYTSPASMQTGLQSYWSVPQPPQPPLPPDDPPPPSDYPPPPPPPPESPPPPPPPPLSDDGEIEEVEMEDEEGEPPAPGTEEDGSRRPPVATSVSGVKTSESAASPGAPAKSSKRKAASSSQLHKAVTIGSSPILYSQAIPAAAPVMSAPVYWNMVATAQPVPPAETTPAPVAVPPSQPAPPLAPLPATADPTCGKTATADKPKKLKKDKTKKSKTKMPSLVKKWQSIQRELDEEEKSSSSDEDRDQLNIKRIEEWKQQQLSSGKAVKNANFEALPEDWRERLLKKRKLTHST
ncbi:formin-binding protein 4 isoform X2 [Arapaima gigas]